MLATLARCRTAAFADAHPGVAVTRSAPADADNDVIIQATDPPSLRSYGGQAAGASVFGAHRYAPKPALGGPANIA